MTFLEILGIALALAMDAFAVAIASSASLRTVTARQYFRLSFHFGFFQFFMPVLGWLMGSALAGMLSACDHWIAFGLLAILGIKMIREAFSADEDAVRGDPTRGLSLVLLSVATSIDALAVGLTFGMLRVAVWYPSAVIGVVAAALTLAGMRMGGFLGRQFGKKMEVVGGLVLVGIGVRILISHLGG